MAATEERETDLYAVLNVPSDASDQQIKRAYKSLAASYHPDKHSRLSEELQGAAAVDFDRIHSAYEVLIDPQKRELYDIYGHEGLRAGMELGPSLKTTEELRREFERLRRQRDQDSLDAKINHRGTYLFSFSLTELLSPYDKNLPRTPELTNIAMNHTVTAPISKKDTATLGGNIASKRGLGAGNFVLAFRRQCSAVSALQLDLVAGANGVINLQGERKLSAHSSGSLSMSYDTRDDVPGLALSLTRQLSGHSEGRLTYTMGPESGVAVHFTRRKGKWGVAAGLSVGMTTGVNATATRQLSKMSSARVSGKLGTTGVEVEVGAGRRLSETSSMGYAVAYGLSGIQLKLRWQRGGNKFSFPLLLFNQVRPVPAVSCFLVPPFVIYFLQRHLIKPVALRRQKRKELQTRTENAEIVRAALAKAAASQELMRNVAGRRRDHEEKHQGLVIESAVYGNLKAKTEYERSEGLCEAPGPLAKRTETGVTSDVSVEETEAAGTQPEGRRQDLEGLREAEGAPTPWIDVTIPLQFMVDGSAVQLYEGISKRGLMGFCDPCPGEDRSLYVAYTFQGRAYETTCSDLQGLKLPDPAHRTVTRA